MPAPHRETALLSFERRLMACQFEVLLADRDVPAVAEAALASLDLAAEVEAALSVYQPDSEFSRINRSAADEPILAGPHTLGAIELALEIQQLTDGAFNLSSASLSELWGFSRRSGRMPPAATIEEAVRRIAQSQLQIDPRGSTVQRSDPSVPINSGGIGKGWAIDRMADLLLDAGAMNFAIHGGHSSMLARGRIDRVDRPWTVAVRHPERRGVLLGELRLDDRSLGTSGPANQFFYYNGVRYGHIIDPRTGWPAGEMLSVTVLHPSAAWADALGTAIYVMGFDAAEQLARTNPEISFLAIFSGRRQGETEVRLVNIPDGSWRKVE